MDEYYISQISQIICQNVSYIKLSGMVCRYVVTNVVTNVAILHTHRL